MTPKTKDKVVPSAKGKRKIDENNKSMMLQQSLDTPMFAVANTRAGKSSVGENFPICKEYMARSSLQSNKHQTQASKSARMTTANSAFNSATRQKHSFDNTVPRTTTFIQRKKKTNSVFFNDMTNRVDSEGTGTLSKKSSQNKI